MIKKPSGPSQRPLTPRDMEALKKSREKLKGGGKPKPGTPGVAIFDDSGMARKNPPGYTNPVPTRDKTGKPLPGMKRGGTVKGKK